MPRTKKSREEELVANARILFSQGGYRDTSLEEIAQNLGITRPLFYYYFESKEDLLWRLIGHLGDGLLDRARPIADSDLEPVDKIRALIRSHTETLLANTDAFRIYFEARHALEGKRDRSLKRGEDAYFGLLTQVVEDGQQQGLVREGPPRVLVQLLTGLPNSVVRWYVPAGRLGASELVVLIADVAVQGIAAHHPPGSQAALRTIQGSR